MFARPWFARLARVLVGIWIGAMIAQAFVGAPLVFGSVPEHIADKEAAANVIGPGFARIDMLGIVALAALLASLAHQGAVRSWRGGLTLVLLAGAATDAFWLAPAITARTEPLGVYHGTATTIWMMGMIGGLLLLLAPPPKAA